MKKTFLLILSAVWLISAFSVADDLDKRLCVEGEEINRGYSDYCAPVRAKRIIYNCAPGFVLAYNRYGYYCHRENAFFEGKWVDQNFIRNHWDILNQTSFPCEPRNVPQDPETGECMPGYHATPYDYYAQVTTYHVAKNGYILDADNAEEMSRLCAYGDSDCHHPYSSTISCFDAIPNCSKCNGTLVCSKCYSGYVLQDGKCVEQVACPSNCAECDSSGVCTKCDSGYVLKNGACAVKPKTQIAFCPPDKTLTADLCCCVSK